MTLASLRVPCKLAVLALKEVDRLHAQGPHHSNVHQGNDHRDVVLVVEARRRRLSAKTVEDEAQRQEEQRVREEQDVQEGRELMKVKVNP